LNYIGIDINAEEKGNKKNGICLCNSNANVIGSNPTNISAYASNIISGNGENGIKLFKSSKNTIVSNFIGADYLGTGKIRNKSHGTINS